ncbi:branched-chain amino acid ABC transporter permease [Comamonas testosteroni]|uniref:Leucine/isoleucine/valine transporter permease subunit n=1 Tax=Comamonas testosteroni TaxID=285 RepID=A0A8B4RY00_COMTE|nr:branched-chain amino acid ABC transporter permease [Comamonas testosteroni]EHN67553.1 inner-membrane translocator [Comamonas testosteroni ATCC 11996]QQN70977.1 branched-chain amino acid ABC transporter permease [Comamonas testosteroni]SUY74035.1 leucine/isoleucine/valine transporter permease subunit [Comamonas testosteroni]
MSNTSSTPLPNTNQAYAEAPAVTNQSRPIRSRSPWVSTALPLAAAVLLAAAQPFWSAYLSDLVVKIMILSIFALSLHILVGGAGLVSLGHAAYFGLGAYAAVKAAGQDGSNFLIMLGAAVGVSGLYALVVGALSLRTKGVYFIMVTLAFAQLAFFVVHDVGYFGGSDGIYLMQRPAIGALDMESSTTQYYVVLAALVLVYAFIAMLRHSRFGHALAGIRVNEQRMRAAGFTTYGYKLAGFVIAGALAGLAGFLLAARDAVVNPELLAWHHSGEVLLMLILGGVGSLRGAVLGTITFVLLKELLSTHAIVGNAADHWQLTLGLAIIALVALLPKGLVGINDKWQKKVAAQTDKSPAAIEQGADRG